MKDENIMRAAALLHSGKLVAFPTETVYGLGADATNDSAVAQIYIAKGRPDFNPLIVHCADAKVAESYVEFSRKACELACHFWPGPLTMVLPRKADCTLSLLLSAGLPSVGIRVPAHAMAQALLLEAGIPIAAPSANRSGRISPTLAEHVRDELGDAVSLILDGGACEVGVESTVIDMTQEPPVLLRPGAITRDQIEERIGDVAVHDGAAKIFASPGMLESHYAPELPIRLDALNVEPGEALLAFDAVIPPGAAQVMQLSEQGDVTEAAANLFAMLRALDRPEYIGIAVMPIPHTGLGIAINDRLKRAAAPR